jgi:GTP-binding protein
MFVDEITLFAEAGDGGNGIVSWLRLKFVAKGGPAGGDGGDGGDVYFKAVRDLSRLGDYAGNPQFKAQNGGHGMRTSKHGADGDDLYIQVPIGSKITHKITGEVFQLLEEGEERLVLRGGRGGYGNEHFKSSRNVAPEEQTDGSHGDKAHFLVELEMLVDLGMIGLPSAGKSSLTNALTNSQARVAEYHFTTLEPHLGSLYGFVLADIPGLIAGAAEGKGLGHKFLRHIKRTRALAHLVSLESDTPIEDYETIRKELGEYSAELLNKDEIIVLSKTDMVEKEYVQETKKLFEETYDKPVIISSVIDDDQLKDVSDFFMQYLEGKKRKSDEEKKKEEESMKQDQDEEEIE